MIYYIPGELIALLTFPGVILHEISHRILCDVQNVPVYAIAYFTPVSKVAGHVIHKDIESFRKSLCIGIAPLVVNSIVCMLLTLPYGISFYLNTSFMLEDHSRILWLQTIVAWVGFSAGLHAIPSDKDVEGLLEKAATPLQRLFTLFLTAIIAFFNAPYIGFWLQIGYAYVLSLVIPFLFLK